MLLLPTKQKRPALNKGIGVMVCCEEPLRGLPFADKTFLRDLCKHAARMGVDLYVFTPQHIDWSTRKVACHRYSEEEGKWVAQLRSLPSVVYDRCFCNGRSHRVHCRSAAARLRQDAGADFMGNGLKSKWGIQRMLAEDEALQTYIPQTEPYAGRESLLEWLDCEETAFLKPVDGSQGKGIVRIDTKSADNSASSRSGGWRAIARGRTMSNKQFRLAFKGIPELLDWTERQVGRRRYLIQQTLDLRTRSGEAFDIRSLAQKNGRGMWEWTGMAARIGAPGSITANLHGGGSAQDADAFLQSQFGTAAAERIALQIERLSMHIPRVLEHYHGRLFELGLDFGVDSTGRVWFIEANSKPGRTAFRTIAERGAGETSVLRPIEYARYLLNHHRRNT